MNAMPDVIVLLPGITGSVLQKDGQVVWGPSLEAIVSLLTTRGEATRKALALPEDSPTDSIDDGVEAVSLMPDLHLIPGLWKIDGYTRCANWILERFEVKENENFFRFPYDWRRDNRYSARVLKNKVAAWLAAWRAKSGRKDAKVILVAHSMGGLVSRYYLENLEGWKDARALITFGTPYRGSLNSVDSLINGVRKGPGGFVDLSDLVRQFTGLYQLLPVYPCFDMGDGKLLRVTEVTGFPQMNAEKTKHALAFHQEIRQAHEENRRGKSGSASLYSIHPIVGTDQETSLSARANGGLAQMLRTYDGEDLNGDGTVPRVSALPGEQGNDPAAMYAATRHGSLQNADAVLQQLEGVLVGLYLDLSRFRGLERVLAPAGKITLDVGDVYTTSEPVILRARSSQGQPLFASLRTDVDGSPDTPQPMKLSDDGWQVASFGPLRDPRAYRVEVAGQSAQLAEDAFLVIP